MWRWMGALVLCLLAVGGSAAARAGAMGATAAGSVRRTARPGETLWCLARRVTPPGGDVRATVERLIEINGLGRGEPLTAGRVLRIPASLPGDPAYAVRP